jgi:hypothetical protein
VDAAVVEVPPADAPPNLYGAVVQSQKLAAVPGLGFTAAKLPLSTAASVPLPFLVTTPSQTGGVPGDVAAASVTVDLWYTPTAIEHQIGTVPGIGGYLASSWLQFVNPPPLDPAQPGSLSTELGSVTIPMVLRGYPNSPALVTQVGSATVPGATTIAQATQWTYTLGYSLPVHYPQDTVYLEVDFNVMPTVNLADASFASVFPALAEFVSVFPQVQADLNGSLALLTEASSGAPVTTAAAAIGAVNQMLAKITGGGSGARRFAVPKPPRALYSSTATSYAFNVVEQPQTVNGQQNVLVVLVAGVSGPLPSVQIAGYTAAVYTGGNPPAGTTQYIYSNGSGPLLDFTTAQGIALRGVAYPGLPILAQQNAIATAYVTRNENLVTRKTTAPAFVYTTPEVTFSEPVQPTLAPGDPIDISLIGSPQVRSLSAHLTALFGALAAQAGQNELTVQVVVTYTFTLNSGSGAPLPITLPLLMQPPLTLSDAMIANLAGAIGNWFAANQPSSVNGQLTFAVTVMTTLTTTTMPMLSLSDLFLLLTNVNPPLPVTSPGSNLPG